MMFHTLLSPYILRYHNLRTTPHEGEKTMATSNKHNARKEAEKLKHMLEV